MPKSRGDYIREELERDFDAPAQTIAKNLAKRGIIIQVQQVYNVRSVMREEQAATKKRQQQLIDSAQKTRAENRQSLSQYILEILNDHPNGLTDVQLKSEVTKAGYVTRSADFLVVLRQKLYDLSKIGKIIKNNGQFLLGAPIVKPAAAPANATVANQDNLTDYYLLRDAVNDFAKSHGLSPDFADELVAARRDLIYAQQNYSHILELKSKDDKDGSK